MLCISIVHSFLQLGSIHYINIISFVHSPVDRHLDCIWLFVANEAAMYICV